VNFANGQTDKTLVPYIPLCLFYVYISAKSIRLFRSTQKDERNKEKVLARIVCLAQPLDKSGERKHQNQNRKENKFVIRLEQKKRLKCRQYISSPDRMLTKQFILGSISSEREREREKEKERERVGERKRQRERERERERQRKRERERKRD
jgi:hypothetical protein